MLTRNQLSEQKVLFDQQTDIKKPPTGLLHPHIVTGAGLPLPGAALPCPVGLSLLVNDGHCSVCIWAVSHTTPSLSRFYRVLGKVVGLTLCPLGGNDVLRNLHVGRALHIPDDRGTLLTTPYVYMYGGLKKIKNRVFMLYLVGR